MRHVRITHTNLAVPPNSESATEVAVRLKCDPEWVINNVGVGHRHVAPPGTDPCRLAAESARPILEQTAPPDCVLYASATVRQFLPDTSVFVARELGLTGVPCFSIHATCLSFVVALNQASLMIKAGQHDRILIVCTELATQSRDFNHPESAALFGDGAASVMLETTEDACGPSHFDLRTWPEFSELSQVTGGGLLKHPVHTAVTESDYLFSMDGERLLRTTMPKLRQFLQDFFAQCGTVADKVDLVIPHQASAAGMKLIERSGFPADKVVNVLADYGNCVSASIPMALAVAQREGRLNRGDQVLFLGSAAGLSLGAMLWTW